MGETALVLFIVAGLLIVVGLSQPLAARLKLPLPVLLGAIGVALGGVAPLLSALGWARPAQAISQTLRQLPASPDTLLYVFLPLLVFEAGIAAEVRRMIDDAAPILLLAIVATLLTSGIVGLALWPLAGVPLLVSLLLGAVVAPTDPVAVIAVFRDLSAPARLTRLIEGESLLNDAAAIALFSVLVGMIESGRHAAVAGGIEEFVVSFVGGGAFGFLAGRAMLWLIPWLGEDRLAEATLTLALAYIVYIAAQSLFAVSGVVAVLGAGLAFGALGRSRITPYNWSFLTDLWGQIAFWAQSLIFIIAAILVPRLLGGVGLRDLLLLSVLIVAALAARLLALFAMLPPLQGLRLMQPISSVYKLAMTWGGLRGALTLVLALSATQNPELGPDSQRFIGVLATGFVLFTLFVNGTSLRPVIALLGLDRLSPRIQVLRDRVLALAYSEVAGSIRGTARRHGVPDRAVTEVVAPYEAWIAAANTRDAEERLSERDRLAIALIALANQERTLLLEDRVYRTAPPAAVHLLLRNAGWLIEGARAEGRVGYRHAAEAALSYSAGFRIAHLLYRRFGVVRLLARRLADRVELLMSMRLLLDRLAAFNRESVTAVFGSRISEIVGEMIDRRREAVAAAFDALRLQYPHYVAALETRFLRESAMRQELEQYRSLFEEGLIPQELYDDLRRRVLDAQTTGPRPNIDIAMDPRRLVKKLHLFSALDNRHVDRIVKMLRPRFVVPNTRILKRAEPGESVFFIASGAVEVIRGSSRMRLGTGDFFGEMALLADWPRQADIVALTYCRLLELRRADFEVFLRQNPDARAAIDQAAARRRNINATQDAALTQETASL